jgi:hypothetical protein
MSHTLRVWQLQESIKASRIDPISQGRTPKI